MIYSLDELKTLILPILQSMPYDIKIDGETTLKSITVRPADEERVADAIIEIIKQDREVRNE